MVSHKFVRATELGGQEPKAVWINLDHVLKMERVVRNDTAYVTYLEGPEYDGSTAALVAYVDETPEGLLDQLPEQRRI